MANKELINWARGEANRLKTAGPPTNSGLQATAMARQGLRSRCWKYLRGKCQPDRAPERRRRDEDGGAAARGLGNLRRKRRCEFNGPGLPGNSYAGR